MMLIRKHLLLSSMFLVCSFVPLAIADDQAASQRWDRSSAMAAAGSVNIANAIYDLGDISSLADGKATVSKLRYLEARSDWPLPAREAAIYQFTRSLADLPGDAVATEVMRHLQSYQAKILVPHEEHPNSYIPLFNIRGAAAGVENGWQRTEFYSEAVTLIETDPEALVSAFAQSANHNQKSGYLDALRYAHIADVIEVQNTALQFLEESPGLTGMVSLTAAITSDTFAIQQLLINGQGAGLSAALVQLDKQLQATETEELLGIAIQQAPSSNAALAIAAWWPRLKHNAATRDLLIDALADPELGASAALALSQEPDIQTIRDLQNTASVNSMAARRAQMALDINRARLVGGTQP